MFTKMCSTLLTILFYILYFTFRASDVTNKMAWNPVMVCCAYLGEILFLYLKEITQTV